MSQFIANLNTVDPPPADDLFSAQDDLSLFASTDFFDFDMGDNLNHVPGDNFDINSTDRKSNTAGWQAPSGTSRQNFLDSKSFFYLSAHPSFYIYAFYHFSHSALHSFLSLSPLVAASTSSDPPCNACPRSSCQHLNCILQLTPPSSDLAFPALSMFYWRYMRPAAPLRMHFSVHCVEWGPLFPARSTPRFAARNSAWLIPNRLLQSTSTNLP
jgi:hypothetical protein